MTAVDPADADHDAFQPVASGPVTSGPGSSNRLWKWVAGVSVVTNLLAIATVFVMISNQEFTVTQVDVEYGTADDFTDDLVDEPCRTELRTLEVALEAWLAQFGGVAWPSEQRLVDDGMLREQSPNFQLADPDVVADAGGECRDITSF